DDDDRRAAAGHAAVVLRAAVGRRVRPGPAGLPTVVAGRHRRSAVRGAVGRDGRLAHADLAAAAGIGALSDLGAAGALVGVVEVGGGAARGDPDRGRQARNRAAAEAVAAVRD